VTNDQASVTFSSNQEEVRQALENALPRLREMMSESGIALGNATVNAGMPDSARPRSRRRATAASAVSATLRRPWCGNATSPNRQPSGHAQRAGRPRHGRHLCVII
jgi:hypothetical protein